MSQGGTKKAGVIIAIMMSLFLLPAQSWAAIPPTFQCYNADSQEIDLRAVGQLHYALKQRLNVAMYIPTNMRATTSQSRVAGQILGHSLENMVKDGRFADIGWLNAIGNFENAFSTRLEIGKSKSADGAKTAQKVNHEMQFNLRPVQSAATIEYQGYVNARMAYSVANQSVDLTLRWTW